MTGRNGEQLKRIWGMLLTQAGIGALIVALALSLGIILTMGSDRFFSMNEKQGAVLFLVTLLAGLVFLAMAWLTARRLMNQLSTAHQVIDALAITDEVTGLINRRHFFERFEEEVDRARRYGSGLSLILLDIDHFRHINETYGHPAGEVVLAEVGRLLSANIRTSDIISRYGGEEFAVLIPARDAHEAYQVAEKLRIVVEVNDITLEGPPLGVTISAGVADSATVAGDGGSLKDALMRAADKAMYMAKKRGRNQVVAYRTPKQRQLPLC